jgi:Domain of unknown function (DUF5916)/Carbohydrate family 9 binding domain-like
MRYGEHSVRARCGWWIVAASMFVPQLGRAQPAAGTPEIATQAVEPHARLLAVRTAEAPKIDGDLQDAVWSQVMPVTAFTQKFPDETHSPSEPTELRVLYDDDSLYIAFNCVQVGSPVTGRLARRDRQVEADWVQVAINDGASTYEFSVNAAGVLGDGERFNDTSYSADWDGVWEANVVLHSHGWSAEMRIPLRIFRRSDGVEEWGFQARRYISHRQETDEWAFIPRSMAGEVSHYGTLAGIANVRRSNALELLPYTSAGINWTDLNPGGHTVGDFGYRTAVGLDLAWRITRDLTLDASFNPDFAQVEADQQVLNLTTYETFIPEKRPFFTHGMTIFQIPQTEQFPGPQSLFYSRRIGSVPPPPVYGDRTAQVSAPEPSTIYAAAKLGGQLGSGVSVGLVSAVTGRNDVTVQPTSGPARQALAEPLAFANVARVKVEVGGGASLGLLGTAVRRFEPADAYPTMVGPGDAPAQQCPDGSITPVGARCFHDAYAVGVDGGWRSSSGTYVAAGQALVTSILHGPPRTMADGTVIKSGDTSPAGRLYLAKEGGQWLGSVQVQAVGRRVDYNDLGYLERQNLVRTLPYLAYRTLDPFWEIAETETHVYLATRHNLDGTSLRRAYYGGGKVRFKNFWILSADLIRYDLEFEDREVGNGTTLEYPSANELDVNLSTDPRRQLAASLSTETESYRGGGRFSLNGELTYQPLSRLELQFLPQLTFTSGKVRFVPLPRDPGDPHLLFGALNARAIGGTVRTSYTFTNRLTLQLYGQLLLVAEHYSNFLTYPGEETSHLVIRLDDLMPANAPTVNPDSAETSLNLSAVLRWEFRLGSTLYVVYSRSQDPSLPLDGDARLNLGGLRRGPGSNAIRLKLSYYWN